MSEIDIFTCVVKYSTLKVMVKNTSEDTHHSYPVVGRDPRINLHLYTVLIHGREVIDYEKIKRDDIELYKSILENERIVDRTEPKEISSY